MWVTPRTWVTSEVMTSSLLNVHLRDNFVFLYKPPRAKLWNDGNQSLSSGLLTQVTFNATIHDTDDMAVGTENALTTWTIGDYSAIANGQFQVIGSGSRIIELYMLGALAGRSETPGSASTNVSVTTCSDYRFTSVSLIQMYANQTSVDSISLLSGVSGPYLSAHWIGGT